MLSRFDITRAGIVMVAAGFPVIAFAQVKDVAPYHAVIAVPSADVHSGDTSVFYRVGAVEQGAIVLVDGESANWSRISYPAGAFAIVRAEDASYDAATKELKLTKASRLFAGNKASGFAGSWKALLPTTLPVGTTMRVLQVEEGANGSGAVAYRVPAPTDARAFTETKNLRKATPAEVSAFRAKGGTVADVSSSPASSPASVTAATPPSTTAPIATAPATPPSATSAPSGPAVDDSLVTPMSTTGTGGAPAAPASTTSTPAPVTIDQSVATPGPTPAAGTPSPVGATPAPVVAPAVAPAQPLTANMRAAARIKDLDQAFDRVNSQPLGEAEYETLISEYENTIQSLSGQLSPRQRALLEQRLNILKFRKDLREQQLALLNESGSAQQQNQQVLQGVAQVEQTRVYSIVGQLQPSTVYNGQTLPLMFRIQSVGTSVPRTLGYIKPDPRFNLESKLGQIVGVIGEASMDKDLKLNVITPVRIDLLQGIPMQQSTQPAMQIPPAPSGQLPPQIVAPQQPAARQPAVDINK
ncbi:MAG: hypothetical protein KF805_13335 [Phycisphaeraceae bacterium]|nr:hypothetical protein [Phycisphaeraceae bacterium]